MVLAGVVGCGGGDDGRVPRTLDAAAPPGEASSPASDGSPASDARPASDGSPASDAPDDSCLGVGTACQVSGECPGQLECLGRPDHGVCMPANGSCGGFAGGVCGGLLSCAYVSPDNGFCLTVEQLSCVCQHQPDAILGC